MTTIGITGGTGFVGRHLTALLLSKGYKVVIFTRNAGKHSAAPSVAYAMWNPATGECDATALASIDAIVHLAGAGIADKRWTDKRKREIVSSRVDGTRFLVSALKYHAHHCKALVSASAIGYYGADNGSGPFAEDSPAAADFLGQTCVKWEKETQKAAEFLRTVVFRFGIVLGKESGAFPELAKPMKFGIMPILGSGKQVVSWIHVNDLAAMLCMAIENTLVKGTYNAVAPKPISHKELMKTIAAHMPGVTIPVPVPSWALKIALGEMSVELLKSCTVSSEKIQRAGFTFQYPSIEMAIAAIKSDRHNR